MVADSFRAWEQFAPAALDVRHEHGRVVIHLAGEHDLSTEHDLSATLNRFCGTSGAGDVVVDLSRTTFIDSTTIALLVANRNLMRDQGRRLILRAPSRQAQRVLELAGAYLLFAHEPAVADELPVVREMRTNPAPAEDPPGPQ